MPELWPYRPELGARERLEWLTDAIGGRTGEQRIALRSAPRQMFEYSARLLDEQQYSRAKTFARRNGAELVYVPVWGEQVPLGAVGSSDTVLSFDTTYGDWREGGFLVVWEADDDYAVCEIDTISSGSITLTAAVGSSFVTPVVIPVRTALFTGGVPAKRGKVHSDLSAAFQVTDNVDLSSDYDSDFPQYQSLDVMTDPIVLLGDVTENIIRASEFVDNGFGPIAVETDKAYADFGQTVQFHDQRGPQLWRRRLWLHALRGKQKTFWLPSNNRDMLLQSSFGSGSVTVTVKSIGPSGGYLNKHVMFRRTNGNRYFREIVNAASAGGGNDTLTISSSLGVATAPSDLDMLCFISLVRLDTDVVALNHTYELCSIVSAPVVEVPE